ncbi:MAG: TadE/TadG family type IV pilus assembly protein [Candidatus Limnocylindria bacterium]
MTTDIVSIMSDQIAQPTDRRTEPRSARGQSLVEFALVLPMLLVLLFGVADFGRVFHAGITVEAAARNAAEAVAQEYLQLRRSLAPPSAGDYDRLHEVAFDTVCEEAAALPNAAITGTNCTAPAVGVCIHDDPAKLPGYVCPAMTSGAPLGDCPSLDATWPAQWAVDALPSVEVRVCYRFTTMFPLEDLSLPFASGLDLGVIFLEKDRTFTVADYGY